MIFLAVLAVATIGASVVLALGRGFGARRSARLGFAIAFAVAGVSHLVAPTPFLQHLPEWVPLRVELVAITGAMEVALGAALLLRQPWRCRAGRATAAYLVAVLPANVYVAAAGVEVDGQPGGFYPWVRLPFQALFVAWVLWCTFDAQTSSAEGAHGHGSLTGRAAA